MILVAFAGTNILIVAQKYFGHVLGDESSPQPSVKGKQQILVDDLQLQVTLLGSAVILALFDFVSLSARP